MMTEMMQPTLFKKTSTGAIQFWRISVEDTPDASLIHTEYGQVGTESPQLTTDRILEGKNLGKSNETSRLEQACLEAQAKWTKQKKRRGYVETIAAAEAGEVDELVQGGINPMLAHDFRKHGHKIVFPAYAQPKLDGVRCIAVLDKGRCTLWTRTRNQITSVPHIVDEIERAFPGKSIMFDGELYNHDLKSDFERIISMVRQEEPHSECRIVQYHIYDRPAFTTDMTWEQRLATLLMLYSHKEFEYLRLVPTGRVEESKVLDLFSHYLDQGYEGMMLRNAHGLYVTKRSYDLLKVKEFDDAEFDIIGITEGRGRLSGHVGAFLCRDRHGNSFEVKLSGNTERLRECFQDHTLWKGKQMTVQYQGLTGKNGVPRFPVGKAIRDYE